MSDMMRILEDLTPLNRVMCSSDFDTTVEYLCRELPFEIQRFAAGEDYNGWIIPPKWDVEEAIIRRNGSIIYDGKDHALAVIALSAPFEGTVDRGELRKHLHYDHRYPDSLTFHFRQQFRNWDRDWGFCVPKNFYDALEEGEYEVTIRTAEGEGYLDVLEYELPGELEQTLVVSATPDHPGVSNDGLAGVVVAVELFKRLRTRNRKFTYRLVLPPSIMGTEYYLGHLPSHRKEPILEGLCLWMLGTETQLALQEARDPDAELADYIEDALRQENSQYRREAFEKVIINDEYIWEAHGISTASLSRMPYPEYHSSRDNVSAMRESSLEEAVTVLLSAIEQFDQSSLIQKKFAGTVCLSNPAYNLYVDPGQIAFGDMPEETQTRMRFLMDLIPSLNRPTTTARISKKIGLPPEIVESYLQRWADKGLLEMF